LPWFTRGFWLLPVFGIITIPAIAYYYLLAGIPATVGFGVAAYYLVWYRRKSNQPAVQVAVKSAG